jgi:UDP-N-acetylmuramate dehydrogenase
MNGCLDAIAGTFRGSLLQNEPMSLHTSLKTGGAADLYAIPADESDLLLLLTWLKQEQIPWMTIGRGYNLLVRDRGISGAVISLERFDRINLVSASLIRAEAGAENLALVRYGQQAGLGGIGFISGIPGTIGGAIKMNAGAYGEGILAHTDQVTLLRNGTVCTLPIHELEFSYRHLKLDDGDIILSATFRNPERSGAAPFKT